MENCNKNYLNRVLPPQLLETELKIEIDRMQVILNLFKSVPKFNKNSKCTMGEFLKRINSLAVMLAISEKELRFIIVTKCDIEITTCLPNFDSCTIKELYINLQRIFCNEPTRHTAFSILAKRTITFNSVEEFIQINSKLLDKIGGEDNEKTTLLIHSIMGILSPTLETKFDDFCIVYDEASISVQDLFDFILKYKRKINKYLSSCQNELDVKMSELSTNDKEKTSSKKCRMCKGRHLQEKCKKKT